MSQQEEHQDKYDFITLARDKNAENATMKDAITKFTEGNKNARSNPSVRRRSLEDITNSISSGRVAAAQGEMSARHSL